ncbi:hypothetical protein N7447_009408 [Penicillium robsamsonii]|uniref:uncharacterized protein n=1 Tax=Penicillium robsamsonii TaxID=1792511 RepID=UPI002548DE0C|nr:uncharacterized protein N7447_009408 [Penicillium robsamsonii]KAJ5817175.1 hypothetical protein N7447_009408 [Penicillium robsamsonii]
MGAYDDVDGYLEEEESPEQKNELMISRSAMAVMNIVCLDQQPWRVNLGSLAVSQAFLRFASHLDLIAPKSRREAQWKAGEK